MFDSQLAGLLLDRDMVQPDIHLYSPQIQFGVSAPPSSSRKGLPLCSQIKGNKHTKHRKKIYMQTTQININIMLKENKITWWTFRLFPTEQIFLYNTQKWYKLFVAVLFYLYIDARAHIPQSESSTMQHREKTRWKGWVEEEEGGGGVKDDGTYRDREHCVVGGERGARLTGAMFMFYTFVIYPFRMSKNTPPAARRIFYLAL